VFGYKDVLEAGEAIAGEADDIAIGEMLQDLPDQEQVGRRDFIAQCVETVEVDPFRSEFFVMVPDHVGDDVDPIVGDWWILVTYLFANIEVTTADVSYGGDVIFLYIFCYKLDVFAAGFVVRA